MLSHVNYSIIINGILKQILNLGMDVSLSDSSATDLLSSSGHEPKSSSSSKGSLSKSSTSLVSTEDETSDEFKKPMSGRSVWLFVILFTSTKEQYLESFFMRTFESLGKFMILKRIRIGKRIKKNFFEPYT